MSCFFFGVNIVCVFLLWSLYCCFIIVVSCYYIVLNDRNGFMFFLHFIQFLYGFYPICVSGYVYINIYIHISTYMVFGVFVVFVLFFFGLWC